MATNSGEEQQAEALLVPPVELSCASKLIVPLSYSSH